MIRWLKRLLLIGIVLLAGLDLYIRFAPNDPAVWHIDPAAPGFTPAANWAAYCPGETKQLAAPAQDAAALLAKLDTVAMASPRTRRLAGSPAEGRITWMTRSALMGYPDFTTASTRSFSAGTQLCVVARQRFGDFDWGVNAARLSAWVQQALALPEPPPRIWN